MIANYHSHTYRCHHAAGTQREYIERAIEAGIQVWGFSDHTPYPFNNGYVSNIRMLPEELEGYVKETLALKEEYRNEIEIHLGLEAEYYPRHFEDLIRLCEGYPIEYLILGQHAVGNEYEGVYSGRATLDEVVLKGYCDQVIEGLETGKFMYVAHPDLINYTGDAAVYNRYMRNLCAQMKAHGIPGEINFLGLAEGRNYPDPRFWKIAGEEGLDVVFGIDAHRPEHIRVPQCEEKALQLVRDCGLHLISRIPMK